MHICPLMIVAVEECKHKLQCVITHSFHGFDYRRPKPKQLPTNTDRQRLSAACTPAQLLTSRYCTMSLRHGGCRCVLRNCLICMVQNEYMSTMLHGTWYVWCKVYGTFQMYGTLLQSKCMVQCSMAHNMYGTKWVHEYNTPWYISTMLHDTKSSVVCWNMLAHSAVYFHGLHSHYHFHALNPFPVHTPAS
jgi:hypothetical protein